MAMRYGQRRTANHPGRHGARPSPSAWLGVLGGLCWITSQAHAAGGHHAVDDAAILAPGQCEMEIWADRERHGSRTLFHAGPACRIGPVEVGLNADRFHETGAGSATFAGPQVKWAHAVTDTVGVGVLAATGWRDRSPRVRSSLWLIAGTWQAHENLAVHVNLGKDFHRGGERPDTRRAGAAVEWAATPAWSFVAERFRESDTNLWRLGARYALSEGNSLDLSQARGLHGSAPPWWTLGVTWAFDR